MDKVGYGTEILGLKKKIRVVFKITYMEVNSIKVEHSQTIHNGGTHDMTQSIKFASRIQCGTYCNALLLFKAMLFPEEPLL